MSSQEQKNELFQKLNAICDVLRKTMDSSEYRNYILGFIFYKFLSEKMVKQGQEILGKEAIYLDLKEGDQLLRDVEKDLEDELGYYIPHKYLFQNWVKKIQNGEKIISLIEDSVKTVENSAAGTKSEDDFKDLFSDIDLTSSKLGNSETEKEKVIAHVINKLNDIEFELDDSKIDILGDAYEYLIATFASDAGKKAGEFYTPQEVSKILAKIVTSKKKKLKNAYDPTCGSGSLLLQVSKMADSVGVLYGQEMKQSTFNLARMNMFLRGKKYHEFNIANEDTIMKPQHFDEKFDVIVANPPFSLPWDAPEAMLMDPRFVDFGVLAPKSKMDFAFIQHMLFQLSDKGIMATVVPHGVLFRGASEGKIRKMIIEKWNWLDAVIGLPANIFFGTSIPTCIMVFRKDRKPSDKVLFIEASREFEKKKNQNQLSSLNIDKIVDSYIDKAEIDKYSKLISLKEIEENEYNLNITRYVDAFEDEEIIDIISVNKELKETNAEIEKLENEIELMISELVDVK
ncbi:MAG: type I restriction-modification system subunit M [Mycoplasmataceae bacterium]|nr:type I restriction-modification system subunit M [Mycoplasmataceae bacterium]